MLEESLAVFEKNRPELQFVFLFFFHVLHPGYMKLTIAMCSFVFISSALPLHSKRFTEKKEDGKAPSKI